MRNSSLSSNTPSQNNNGRSSNVFQNIPPPLPDRSKSAEETILKKRVAQSTSVQENTLGEHYAHLDKHVTEVRRRKNRASTVAPKLSDFRVQKGDKVISTDWIKFLEAWIKYFVSTAAYDEADRSLEPFSLHNVKHDMDRIYPMIVPFIAPAKQLRIIYRWENGYLTGAIFTLYCLLWYYDLILVCVCAALAVGIAWIRLDMFAQYGVDVLEEQPETEATVRSWNRNFWMKMRTRMGTASAYGFNLFDDIDINISEWRNDLYMNYGPTMQIMLADTVDYLERIKNLVTWKRPARTRFLLAMVVSTSIVLLFLPAQHIGKGIFFYIGVEFFVLQALRSYYPRHRRLFNVLNLILWDVPNDAEFAMEVVRLNGNSSKNGASAATVVNRGRLGVEKNSFTESPRAAVKAPFASMSDIPTSVMQSVNEEVAKSPNKNKVGSFQEVAVSTASTLAMLAAAAAVNKVKKTVDKNKKKKEPVDDSIATSPSHDDTDTPFDDDPDVFGCMYKGTIPGRLALRGNGFVFQTSRMTGALVLVECAFDEIVGVRKTKQYDIVVWHSNGLDISMSDGSVLHFENVLRRDDCFNRLVSASGEEGAEWKKM